MSLYRFLLTSLVVLLLASCGGAPTKPVEAPTVNQATPSRPPVIDTKKDYIKIAEETFAQTGSLSQRNEWLIKAAEALQQQGECNKSLKFLQVLLPELTEQRQINTARLIYSECLVTLGTPEALDLAKQSLSDIKLITGYEHRVYALQATLFSQQQAWLKASQALLRSDMPEPAKSQQIWRWLQNLELSELRRAQSTHGQLQSWLQLSIILHLNGLKPQQLIEQVANWQSTHSQHALASNLPPEITRALTQQALPAANIAVLLPLSGRLASQGLALKEGILAAYLANLAKTASQDTTMATNNREPAYNLYTNNQNRYYCE